MKLNGMDLLKSGPVSIGDDVYIPEIGVIAEVSELHKSIKNYITKVKVIRADGSIDFIEVSDLAIEGIILLKKISLSKLFKAALNWIRNFKL